MDDSNFVHDPVFLSQRNSSPRCPARFLIVDPVEMADGTGARLRTRRFCGRVPLCASNIANRNQVGFLISHVKLETPTTQTIRQTIQTFLESDGMTFREKSRVPSNVQ